MVNTTNDIRKDIPVKHMQTNFPNAFFGIMHTSLASIFISCKQKYILLKLQISQLREFI